MMHNLPASLRYLSIAALLLPSCVSAATVLNPVSDMFFNGLKRHEIALVANAAARCGALYTIVGQVLLRDTADTAAAERFDETGMNFSLIAMHSNAALLKQRGVNVDVAALNESALKQLDQFTEIYVERMTKNQQSDGEMWGSDELIQSDISFCTNLTILNGDEWSNTLITGDWKFWDELFE
jgi:hypothetical protein